MSRLKKTVGVGEVAARVVKKADPAGKRHGAKAVAAWREVAGDEIARRTRGFALRGAGELVVYVESAAWANQLSLMAAELIERINSHLGEKAVNSLRFTVSRAVSQERAWEDTVAANEEYYAGDEIEPLALDETERQQAAYVASAVKDEGLREVALRVMIKDLERKKGERARARNGAGNDPQGAPPAG